MKYKISMWVIPLIIILLGSCDIKELEDPIIIADLDDEFELTLWEELYPTGRSLQLLIETIKDEPCQNAQIVNAVFKNGSSFNVTLQDITTPSDCQTGIGPATAVVNLGQINPGVYNLDINLKNTVINEGQLNFSTNRYLIQMKTDNGIKFIRSELYAIPVSFFWGYIAYDAESLKEDAEAIRSQLGLMGEAVALTNGDYGYFQVSNQQVAQITAASTLPTSAHVIPFGWGKKENNEIQQEEIERMRASMPAGMQLFVMDDKGKAF